MCFWMQCPLSIFFFFFNDTATTEIYTLSLHDALPISTTCRWRRCTTSGSTRSPSSARTCASTTRWPRRCDRSEEHTSELQSQSNLVCRLLLEKKKKNKRTSTHPQTCIYEEYSTTNVCV